MPNLKPALQEMNDYDSHCLWLDLQGDFVM
jgi:hypothetical protein